MMVKFNSISNHRLINFTYLENCFATASGTSGYLYIWDATRLAITYQINIHNAIINRVLFHPNRKYDQIELKDFF